MFFVFLYHVARAENPTKIHPFVLSLSKDECANWVCFGATCVSSFVQPYNEISERAFIADVSGEDDAG